MNGRPPPEKAELPTTIGWYRDAANWIVGLSAGAVAAGLAYHEQAQHAPAGFLVLFAVSGLFFVAAIVSGIQFYFWLTTYANRREHRAKAQADLDKETDASKKAALEQQITEDAATMEKAERWFGAFYKALLWCFNLGVIGFTIVTLRFVVTLPIRTHVWSLTTVPCCTVHCRIPQPNVLRIDQTTGDTWYLMADSLTAGEWHRIPVEP